MERCVDNAVGVVKRNVKSENGGDGAVCDGDVGLGEDVDVDGCCGCGGARAVRIAACEGERSVVSIEERVGGSASGGGSVVVGGREDDLRASHAAFSSSSLGSRVSSAITIINCPRYIPFDFFF